MADNFVCDHTATEYDYEYGSERCLLCDMLVVRSEALLPTDRQERKDTPIATGVLDYFPLALAEVARVSRAGNEQHHAGQPLHWDKSKSTDHADSLVRHLLERGTLDTDGMRHSAKVAWRALALLQTELEQEVLDKRP